MPDTRAGARVTGDALPRSAAVGSTVQGHARALKRTRRPAPVRPSVRPSSVGSNRRRARARACRAQRFKMLFESTCSGVCWESVYSAVHNPSTADRAALPPAHLADMPPARAPLPSTVLNTRALRGRLSRARGRASGMHARPRACGFQHVPDSSFLYARARARVCVALHQPTTGTPGGLSVGAQSSFQLDRYRNPSAHWPMECRLEHLKCTARGHAASARARASAPLFHRRRAAPDQHHIRHPPSPPYTLTRLQCSGSDPVAPQFHHVSEHASHASLYPTYLLGDTGGSGMRAGARPRWAVHS